MHEIFADFKSSIEFERFPGQYDNPLVKLIKQLLQVKKQFWPVGLASMFYLGYLTNYLNPDIPSVKPHVTQTFMNQMLWTHSTNFNYSDAPVYLYEIQHPMEKDESFLQMISGSTKKHGSPSHLYYIDLCRSPIVTNQDRVPEGLTKLVGAFTDSMDENEYVAKKTFLKVWETTLHEEIQSMDLQKVLVIIGKSHQFFPVFVRAGRQIVGAWERLATNTDYAKMAEDSKRLLQIVQSSSQVVFTEQDLQLVLDYDQLYEVYLPHNLPGVPNFHTLGTGTRIQHMINMTSRDDQKELEDFRQHCIELTDDPSFKQKIAKASIETMRKYMLERLDVQLKNLKSKEQPSSFK